MPLPSPPTRRLNNAVNRQADRKADNEMVLKGALCALIGIVVIVAPYVATSPNVREIVSKAALVGWFALVLGCAFIGVAVWRRVVASRKD